MIHSQMTLETMVSLLSWICFTSVLLGHLVYDILCYFAVAFIRFLIQRVRVRQCKIKS